MVERVFKIGVVIAILLATFVGCQRQNLLNKVTAYVDAANRHDLAAIDAMLTDDVVFEMNGTSIALGKEQVRTVHDNEAGFNTELELTDCKEKGNTVTCKITERNDYVIAAGINEINYTSGDFTFKNGLIQKISATMSPESIKSGKEFDQGFVAWVKQNRSEELAKLMTPAGKFKWGRESAKIMVNLVKEYQAQKK
jgi:ketosteroid isomerase-like protein